MKANSLMRCLSLASFCLFVAMTTGILGSRPTLAAEPFSLIFDTDMGNDIDDALALAVIHALADRGECRLLAVTVSKDNPFAARYCDVVNTFYGRGDIPIGRVRDGKRPEDGKFVRPVSEAMDNGQLRYPHDLKGEADTPDAVPLLRRILAEQPDRSVALVGVGLSTNMARLLESEPDQFSPLDGRALVEKKVALLSMMGGRFGKDRPKDFKEFNIKGDLDASTKVLANWPTPIVISGFEIGLAIRYPAESIEQDFNYRPHHPIPEAYKLYIKMPYDRPTWDLTSVLYAVRPNRNYFGISEPGTLSIGEEGFAKFTADPNGAHRYLSVTPEQIVQVREALVMLASQPPIQP